MGLGRKEVAVWYWRPIRSQEDFEQGRAHLRQLVGASMTRALSVEEAGARELLIELLEGYEVLRALEQAESVTGAALLSALMARHGLGPYQLAKRLGVGHARVSEVMSGRSPLPKSLARALLAESFSAEQVLMALLAPTAKREEP